MDTGNFPTGKCRDSVCTKRRNFVAFLAKVGTILIAAAPLGVAAHGDIEALRGGIVAWAGELSLELVPLREQVVVYVDDHGVPADVQGVEATISVAGPDRSPAQGIAMTYQGENRFVAPTLSATPGSRISVVLKHPDGQVAMARFVIR